MVTLETAGNALKSVYLQVAAEQINIATNPLYSKIKHTSKDINGKEIVKLAPFGVNGGFGAGGETTALPVSGDKGYVQFRTSLKNLYGKFEISDKAVRASANNAGAFVNLLADEMESLVKSCAFNLNRMIYGDGTGLLATVSSVEPESKVCTCASVNNLVEGMLVDIFAEAGTKVNTTPVRITSVDRTAKTFSHDGKTLNIEENAKVYVQGSKDNEITGLGALFGKGTLYGLSREDYAWLKPYTKTVEEISDIAIQEAIDYLEEYADSRVDFISASSAVRRAYQQYLNIYRKNVDIADIGNGYKAITHNGIPIYADKFADNDAMFLLNTDDFVMHELCDWQWMEDEQGHVLRQNPGYPTYTATLVKYADLICNRPLGQGKLTGISGTVTNPYLS